VLVVRVSEWVLGIAGAIAVFFGLVLVFVAEDEYVAFAGSAWRAGDIAAGWTYGLLIGGVVLLAIALALVVRGLRHPRRRKR
jgi:hypothetical protein